MKKLSQKQKKANIRYGEKRFLRNLKSKKNKKIRNKKILLNKTWNKRQNNKKKKIVIKMPKQFSFIDHVDNFIEFINETIESGKIGYPIYFDISEVEYITFDSLCLMMAVIKTKIKGKISGNIPKKENVKELFLKSGFINLNGNERGKMNNYKSDKCVGTDISAIYTKYIVDTLYNGDRLLGPQIHPIFIEIMKNTNNHAGSGYNRRIFRFYDEEKGDIKICLLDLGVGILESLPKKNNGLWKHLGKNLHISSLHEEEQIKGLLTGSITKIEEITSTHEAKRGNGLKQIGSVLQHEKIKTPILITNNVKYNILTKQSYVLKNQFKGTFYYWEMVS